MKSEKRNSQNKVGDSSSNFAITQRIFMFCMVVIFLMLPVLTQAQNSTVESTVKQSAYLENHGKNATTFTFDKDTWQYVIVKLNGTYQKDLTKKPSQNFTITVNGETIFSGDLYGGKTITRELNYEKASNLVVSAKLISVHGASSNAAGNVEIIAFRERPGVFVVTDIFYDFSKKKEISNKPLRTGVLQVDNTTDDNTTGTYKKSYTESESISWTKSTSHTESVKFSVGAIVKAEPVASVSISLELMASITTGYSTTEAKQKTTTESIEADYKVPPGWSYTYFIQQSDKQIEVPYTLSGYVLVSDNNGNYKKEPKIGTGKCLYGSVSASNLSVSKKKIDILTSANTDEKIEIIKVLNK